MRLKGGSLGLILGCVQLAFGRQSWRRARSLSTIICNNRARTRMASASRLLRVRIDLSPPATSGGSSFRGGGPALAIASRGNSFSAGRALFRLVLRSTGHLLLATL